MQSTDRYDIIQSNKNITSSSTTTTSHLEKQMGSEASTMKPMNQTPSKRRFLNVHHIRS